MEDGISTILYADSVDDMLFFLFHTENKLWSFMQIVSKGDNLHERSKPVFWEK